MSAHAAPFTAGNLVIYRLAGTTNSGAIVTSASLTNAGNIVWLDEFTTNGTYVQSIMMPTNYFGANSPLIGHGTTFGSGLITRSADGRFVVVAGYGATLGQYNFSLQSATSIEAPRIIGLVGGNGNIDTTTAVTNSLVSGDEIRSAASTDGTNLWFAGAVNGAQATTRGSTLSTQLSTFVTNLRQLQIVSNTLYFSTASGSAVRIGTIGTQPPPTTNGSFMATLPGVPTDTNSPFGFALLNLTGGSGPDTLYFGDTGANVIWKYSLVGTNWVSNGSFSIGACVGLAARVRNSGTIVDIWTTGGGSASTGGDSLWYVADTAGYNAAPSITGNPFVPVYTAPGQVSFRGITFAPVGGDPFPVGPGQLSVGPILGLFARGNTGCAVTTTVSYSVANFGTNAITWQATTDVNWVTLTPSSGSLAAGGSVTVSASFNANALSLTAGTNTASITFTNTTSAPNDLGTTTRAIRLILTDNNISPSSDFISSGQPGGPFSPTNIVYTVFNGSTPFTLAISKTASWLDLSATSISVGGCTSTTVTVSLNANANSLAAGNYSDVISFSNATTATLIGTRNVTLAVGGIFFCDDFSTYNPGNLVGQQGWLQVGTTATQPLQVTNGAVRVPDGQVGDNQDAYKNFPQQWNTTVFAGMLLRITTAPATNQQPSYIAALYNLTNAGNFANYRLAAQDADGTGTNAFRFSARTTGQAGAPWTNSAATFSYNTDYRVIIRTDPGGTNTTVYVNPTSADLGAQTPVLIAIPTNPGGIGLATNVGSFVISQFQGATAFPPGAFIKRVCVNTNYADVYNGITPSGPPPDPFATWQFTYFGCTNCPQALPGADPDGDGMSNTNEFLAGFNPTNSAAYLRIISIVNSGSDVRVTYLGANGDSSGSPGPKTNVLEFTAGTGGGSYSNNFASTGQTNILTGGTGSGVITNMVDPGGATNVPSRYYRVRVLTQ